jgi:hypothetical protein
VVGDGSKPVTVVILDGDTEVSILRVAGPAPPDLSVVEALVRIQLAARRLGWSIRLRDPCPQLLGLLELVGLTDVVAVLPIEAGGEAEGGEQIGVDEVVEPGDPAA